VRRRAHTITELLLVLTILSLFAVIAIPRVASAVLRTKLDAAFEAVRGDLAFTRARAVSTGLRHQFVMDTGTGEIAVEPFRPEALDAASAPVQPEQSVVLRDTLPESVTVATWTVSPLGAMLQPGGAAGAPGTEAAPLVFYPEGNCDDAILILEGPQGARRGLRVDGFSGEIREMQPEELDR
jgi:type II secretory pathway pseudopilin PulG